MPQMHQGTVLSTGERERERLTNPLSRELTEVILLHFGSHLRNNMEKNLDREENFTHMLVTLNIANIWSNFISSLDVLQLSQIMLPMSLN